MEARASMALAALVLLGCSGSPDPTLFSPGSPDPVETYAHVGTGGLPGAPLDGGRVDRLLGTGGAPETNPGEDAGQAGTESGGSPGAGGSPGTGGAIQAGSGGLAGNPSTGGYHATGGAQATGGAPGTGGHPPCQPKTWGELCTDATCGVFQDGCGGTVDCGTWACQAAGSAGPDCVSNACTYSQSTICGCDAAGNCASTCGMHSMGAVLVPCGKFVAADGCSTGQCVPSFADCAGCATSAQCEACAAATSCRTCAVDGRKDSYCPAGERSWYACNEAPDPRCSPIYTATEKWWCCP